jgi:hypothetical protein
MIIISHYYRIAFRGVFTEIHSEFQTSEVIFNGLSEVYPTMKQGKCFFHMKRNIREGHYNDATAEIIFLMDLTSSSKSQSHVHFDCSVPLFIKTYVEHENKSFREAAIFLEKFWLAERNQGWLSGLVPGTVTSNNGLEVTNGIETDKFVFFNE